MNHTAAILAARLPVNSSHDQLVTWWVDLLILHSAWQVDHTGVTSWLLVWRAGRVTSWLFEELTDRVTSWSCDKLTGSRPHRPDYTASKGLLGLMWLNGRWILVAKLVIDMHILDCATVMCTIISRALVKPYPSLGQVVHSQVVPVPKSTCTRT